MVEPWPWHGQSLNQATDDEGLDLLHHVIAVVGIDFDGDGLREIQAEYAQYGLRVHDVPARAQINVVGIAAHNVDKCLYVFRQAQFYIDLQTQKTFQK